MRIPKKLSICGHDYTVIYKHEIEHEGKKCWGLCDSEKHLIYLEKGMDKSQEREILLHECIHAIQEINNHKTSEASVKTLSLALLALIRNNKLNFLI